MICQVKYKKKKEKEKNSPLQMANCKTKQNKTREHKFRGKIVSVKSWRPDILQFSTMVIHLVWDIIPISYYLLSWKWISVFWKSESRVYQRQKHTNKPVYWHTKFLEIETPMCSMEIMLEWDQQQWILHPALPQSGCGSWYKSLHISVFQGSNSKRKGWVVDK